MDPSKDRALERKLCDRFSRQGPPYAETGFRLLSLVKCNPSAAAILPADSRRRSRSPCVKRCIIP